MNEEEIRTKAIKHYGEPAQVLKCIEELAELQLSLYRTLASYRTSDQRLLNYIRDHAEDDIAICKNVVYNEIVVTPYNIENICSELADVLITTSQIKEIFNITDEQLQTEKEFKLKRLEERIQQ